MKGSRIADVLDRISPQGNGPFAIVAAWTSAAYDATRDRVLKAACGGNADWPGNEVFAFAPSTGQWSLLRASSPGSVYGARGIVSASGSSPSVVTTTTAHGFRDGLFVAVASSTNVFLGAGPVTVTGYPANQFAIASLSGDPAGGAAQPADDPYTDGNPSSVHTYGAQAYIPPPYDYLLRGPGARWPDGNSTSKMWGYRQAANTWARLAPIAPGGIQASHTHFIWDPITAKLYAWYGDTGASGFSYYSSYDPALDTWTLLRKGDWAARVDWLTAAFDSKRRRFLLAGLKSPGIPVIAYRPILGGAVTEATVDRSDVLAEFCALSAPGFEYDANSDRFIGWAARTAGDGRSTFVIDPSTSPWKIVKNTRNTGDEPPVTRNGNGVLAYKHFLSIGDGLMLLIPPTDITDDTYYYRVSASTSA